MDTRIVFEIPSEQELLENIFNSMVSTIHKENLSVIVNNKDDIYIPEHDFRGNMYEVFQYLDNLNMMEQIEKREKDYKALDDAMKNWDYKEIQYRIKKLKLNRSVV